jgi:cyanate permease
MARPATWHRPADITRELVTLLRAHGLTHLYWSACTLRAVISVAPCLTVWTDGRHLTWTRHGTCTTLPACDTGQAAEHLARLARQPTPPTTSPEGSHDDPAIG